MSQEYEIELLKNEFSDSLHELLAHYVGDRPDFKEVEIDSLAPKAACAASVGFSHELMRGAAVLLVSHAECMNYLGAPDGCDGSDWVGELGNQLVGRFKNKVVAYGPLIDMALPSVICGKDLVHGCKNHVAHWHSSWHGFEISAILNLELEDGLHLDSDEQLSVAEEGSLCFF